ncbi:MAG: hypothetical protein BGP06_12900 [Rhizobiales bacterium 65-9]|nr:MAG: hypothetical protein BGP06_12900 [Rhizobiales bacterium 65-9]
MRIVIGRARTAARFATWILGGGFWAAAACLSAVHAQEGDAGGAGGGDAAFPADAVPATGNPYIFAPDILTPVDQSFLVQSLNTPSGVPSFLGVSAIPRGLHFNIDETVRYNDNARNLPNGVVAPSNRSKGDLYSVTNVGGTASTQLGLQTFFVTGYYGLTRYRRNFDLNSDRYSLSAGVNWRLGSPCSGSLVFSTNQSELELQDIGFGASNSLTKTDRADFQGRCHIFNRFYATYGAGLSRYSVSSTPLNDYRQWSARAGLEYAVPKLHTLGVEAVYLKNNFINRVSSVFNPLATDLAQEQYRAYYTYIVSPKTTVNLSAGISKFKNTSALGDNSVSVPTYSASINWRATPKILFTFATQYSAGPPQGVLADYQRSSVTSASIAYAFSRKLSFSGAYVHSRTSSSVFSPILGAALDLETRTNTASLDANYRMTPFLSGGLGYRFSERTDKLSGLTSKSNLYTVSLNYRR